MHRIVIIGATGSGKTTLGRRLAEKMDIPAVDLDDIHWLPGWQTRDVEEARRLIDAATQKPAWTVSGNYGKLQDIFWPRADTMIWLDYPFVLVFFRLLRRSIRRIVDRQAICNGNFETWPKFLSKESVMIWLFQSFRRRKRENGRIFSNPDQYPHLTLIRFQHPKETELWLKNIKNSSS